MDMTIPVTLIVKAPNQQIEDQTVKCELSWTISKLKNHLSEVYPSKPARHEQKLIYSGQLLPDTVVLKDVLRNYDGQDTHTVHLVCAPSKNTFYQRTDKKKMNESSTQQNVQQENQLNQTPSATTQSINASSNVSSTNSSQIPNQVPDFRTVWTSLAQTYPGIPEANQYAVHAAIMQQAYAQYVNQYMQMYTHQRYADHQQPTQPEPVQPEPANVNEANRNDQDIDDPQQDRDWLDWFYVLSRVIVLFCIVYFYSSPLRFALVLLLGVGLYLYQTGFFRAPVLNNNDANQRQENNNLQNGGNNDSNDSTQQNAQIDQRPSAFAIMWTFFTSFFASLIPEIPNAL